MRAIEHLIMLAKTNDPLIENNHLSDAIKLLEPVIDQWLLDEIPF